MGTVSNLPISSKYRSTPAKPVDEEERERLTRQLNDAFTRGELSQEEYAQLLDTLFAARTLGDLVPVVERARIRPAAQQPAIVETETSLLPGQVNESAPALRLGRYVVVGSVVGLVLLLLLAALLLL